MVYSPSTKAASPRGSRVSLETEIALLAFAVSLPLTILFRLPTKAGRIAAHAAVPRIGGFPIIIAFVVTPPLAALFSPRAEELLRDEWGSFAALVACGGAVFLVGAIDDFHDVRWHRKLTVHVAAAVALYLSGFGIEKMTVPGGGHFDLWLLDPIVTVAWVVFLTNAMNFLDGHDGVAAGVAALASATLAYAAIDLGHDLVGLLFAALAGAALGFVPLNLPPAKRFLGDSGAYFLGFTLAALSISGFLDASGRVPLYIPVVAVGLPVLDTSIAILRRILDRRPPMQADRDHFHDRLARHLSPFRVALVTYAISAGFCAAALVLLHWYKSAGSAVVGAVVLLFAVALVAVLGYVRTMWQSVRHPRSPRVIEDAS